MLQSLRLSLQAVSSFISFSSVFNVALVINKDSVFFKDSTNLLPARFAMFLEA